MATRGELEKALFKWALHTHPAEKLADKLNHITLKYILH
jgi:hypothetical protein